MRQQHMTTRGNQSMHMNRILYDSGEGASDMRTPPMMVGIYGFLIAMVCSYGFRLLIVPDPDPTARATVILSALGFAIPFGVAYFLEDRRQRARVEAEMAAHQASEAARKAFDEIASKR